MEKYHMSNLKNLMQELEQLLNQNHSRLDTEEFAAMQLKVDQLKHEIDKADSAKLQKLASEALRLLASLLSVVTNVMTLLK